MEKQIKIALAGNPNSGKTTLFNALTGSNQFVGNWPGVTVEKKEGKLKKHDDVVIMDLPGIYSLSPYTLEEVVSRNYLITERPDAILNIVDGTNLERNLYLTTQLTELGIPVVVAINMMDVVKKNGDQINIKELSRQLGCPVLEISALKGTGIMEAAEAAVKAAAGPHTEPQHTFSGPVEHAIAHTPPLFPEHPAVACQGVEGANSQVACDRLLPRGSILYVKTFDAVVSAVESGLCKFGVLPIENSSNGSVRAVYSLLQQHQLSVVRSTRLCIRHELLAMPGVKLEDITEIYSHQQAIGQCSRFLSSLSGVRVIPCGNTAEAAKLVAESGSRHAAAISSHPCAALYGLECVSDKIQDSENNYTRFFCVAKDPVIYAGANRISLILSFENKPGALYEILSKLAALDINMTKLESCPVAGSDFEFVFFLELEASVQDPSVLAMLEEMERSCAEFVFLGNYAEV